MRRSTRTSLSVGLGIVFAALASAASAKDAPAVLPPSLRPVAEVAADVDARMIEAWTGIGLERGPAAPDAEFLRRATLDIAGRLPTADEARTFLANTSNDRRQALVARLSSPPLARNCPFGTPIRNRSTTSTPLKSPVHDAPGVRS